MAGLLDDRIRADQQFRADCEKAAARAARAMNRARDRLSSEEGKERERHCRTMADLDNRRRALFKDVYAPIYDPLEEAAFARAQSPLADPDTQGAIR